MFWMKMEPMATLPDTAWGRAPGTAVEILSQELFWLTSIFFEKSPLTVISLIHLKAVRKRSGLSPCLAFKLSGFCPQASRRLSLGLLGDVTCKPTRTAPQNRGDACFVTATGKRPEILFHFTQSYSSTRNVTSFTLHTCLSALANKMHVGTEQKLFFVQN